VNVVPALMGHATPFVQAFGCGSGNGTLTPANIP
jgi:hypothetical protein